MMLEEIQALTTTYDVVAAVMILQEIGRVDDTAAGT